MVNPFRKRAEDFPGRLFNRIDDERELFHSVRSGELYLELGSGSGQHLIEQAKRRPEGKCFGIELRYKRSVRTLEKAGTIQNLYVLRAHIHRVAEFFPKNSVRGIWVNFPDPWEKRPKNRILRPKTLDEVIEILGPGGFFSFKTDHLEFFDTVHGQLLNDPRMKIEQIWRDVPSLSEIHPENVETEFEQLFRNKRIPVSQLLAVKRSSP